MRRWRYATGGYTERGRRKLYTPVCLGRVRSCTNRERQTGLRHDGQPHVDTTTTVDESRTMPRHSAGNPSAPDRASARIPISTASAGSSRNTGSCISQTQEGDFRPRLLLASARLSPGATTRHQPRILGPETRPEHRAGYRQCESAPTARMDDTRSLGMRNQAHGGAGAPSKRVFRYEEIEIVRTTDDIDQSTSRRNGDFPDYAASSRCR